MTILPCLSASCLNCLIAHWRHAPREPNDRVPAEIRQIEPERDETLLRSRLLLRIHYHTRAVVYIDR